MRRRSVWLATGKRPSTVKVVQLCSGWTPSFGPLRGLSVPCSSVAFRTSLTSKSRRAVVHVEDLPIELVLSHRRALRFLTYRVHGLQNRISVDVHVHRTPALNASVHHTIACISKAQILFLKGNHRISDGKLYVWKVVGCRRTRENITLTILVVLRAGDSVVDSFHKAIIDQTECSTGIHNGGVSRASYILSIDAGGCGLDLPESLAVINISIVGLRGSRGCQNVLIDETKGVEALVDNQCVSSSHCSRWPYLSLVSLICITPAAKIGSKQLLFRRLLCNNVAHRGLLLIRSHGVDGAKGKTQKTTSVTLTTSAVVTKIFCKSYLFELL